MFLTYTFCRRGGAGGNFAQGHQHIKICIPFLLSGGAGGNFAQVWELANKDSEFEFQSVYA